MMELHEAEAEVATVPASATPAGSELGSTVPCVLIPGSEEKPQRTTKPTQARTISYDIIICGRAK